MRKPGKLFLIPTPLGEGSLVGISEALIDTVYLLDYFVVERGKTARQFLKQIRFPRLLQTLEFVELNEHTPATALQDILEPILQGKDAGLLSEAGCPAVADPGSALVLLAHQHGVEVIPMVGPSSILLALMASGMNGQSFCFHGYLSAKKPELVKQIRLLEQQSGREKRTQIFIETPYRSVQLLETLIQTLAPGTLLSVAADLTLPTQYIRTQPVASWRTQKSLPDLQKRPAVFLIYSA